MKYQAAGVLGIALIILATALSGVKTITYSTECTDGVNNDGSEDPDIDIMDVQCFEYPYSDGNGESIFDGQMFAGKSYASLFDYHITYSDPPAIEQNICFGDALNMYDNVPGDKDKFDAYVELNDINCQGQGP